MSRSRALILVVVLAGLLALVPMTGALAGGTAVASGEVRAADAVSSASPNYRTFSTTDLESIQKKGGGLDGGHYTCLKSSAPYTYFEQDWYGVNLSYLLNQEVGMKSTMTSVKFIASDGYNVTLTPAQLGTNGNPSGLNTMLGWKSGPAGPDEQQGVTPVPENQCTAIGGDTGPMRLIVPQSTPGVHGVGDPNWQLAVRNIRAIEVQPVPPGIPALDPAKIPEGQLVVYGAILNRHTFTVDQLKSLTSTTATYHWLNKSATEGDSPCTGIALDYLLDEVVGMRAGATDVTVMAQDTNTKTWLFSLADIRTPSAVNGLKPMLAWNVDNADLTPAEGTEPNNAGPLEYIKPQNTAGEVNKSKWIKGTRILQVEPIAGEPAPYAALDPMTIPSDRIIVCGLVNANNIPNVYYFAEGCTREGFSDYICVANPNPWKTHLIVDYMAVDGSTGEKANTQKAYDVNADSRVTINVNTEAGVNKDVSVRVEGYHGDSIIAERAMYWNGMSGGHCNTGITSTQANWYFAEGSTANGFETYILLQNPGDANATASIDYMTVAGLVHGPQGLILPPQSRTTINVADTADVSNAVEVAAQVQANNPIVVERAVYWNGRSDGSCTAGANVPGTEWYFAEGSTGTGGGGPMETYILLQNPGDTLAHVNVIYMNESGAQAPVPVNVAAHQRVNVYAGDTLAGDNQVSTKVTSDQEIVAERAVYWNSKTGGTCGVGAPSPLFKHYLAEGCTDQGFSTWLLLQNPGATDATVYITYLTGNGPVEKVPYWLPAGTRQNVNVFEDVGATTNVSAEVISSVPIVVERSVFWGGWIGGSCSKGYGSW